MKNNYYAKWKYKDAYYQLSGQLEKEELDKNFIVKCSIICN